VEAHRNLFTVLSDKLMGARIREQGETGTIRIIDPASFPLQPTQSHPQKRALMVLALAAGIAFGMAFGIEFWRQPVETESDIKNLTNLGVLGSVGVIGTPAARWKKHLKTKRSPLPIHLPDALVPTAVPMELYRAIRATLETERLKGAFRSILVTSPGPSEGKSTTILNLAHVLQEFGRRVLVVEADLRQPVLHRLLNLPVTPSLVDFLRGAATLQDVCHALPSGVTVIPGQIAREDVGTLLAPARARELLKAAKTHYDTVLIDSAPLLAVPDDLLLLPVIDRVILVVKASVTSKRDLRRATAVLEYANARTLGVILNQAHPHDVHYYRRRYRKYYPMVDGQPTVVAPRGFRPLSWIRDKLPFGRSSGSSGVEVPSQQEAGSEQPAAGSTERRET
jgi:capsular exopolysaccharide synthesis family protein